MTKSCELAEPADDGSDVVAGQRLSPLALSITHDASCHQDKAAHVLRAVSTYFTTIMQRPHDIDHEYLGKLLMKGPSENCSTNPPPISPPHPLEDNLFRSPDLPVSHP
ncbi:hypothetical protein INR49_030809 [Caranx melampygus]|nr:hypothetical protein INR49_030809 [Caranx melampygus]